ncbi:MAG: TIM barrel protein [Variovorax sp.]|nr:TIM barrel protein [Variovorax sp.]
MNDWHLRYAPHLGYRPPFEPLFKGLVASDDLVDHVAFAADQGFAGVCHPAARGRSPHEQERLGRALARHGMEAGCVLYTGFDQLRNTSWATRGEEARAWIAGELREAIAAAKRVGSRRLAVLAGADPMQPLALQRAAMAEHLRWAGDLAAQAGMTLCLETLSRKSIPGMLLQHVPDAHAVARAADHPAVRVIFDTSHVQIMDGDLLFHLDQVWDRVEIVQLADNPGRFEPGTGEINFESVLRALSHRGYRGLVELEHGWASPGIDSERRGLETLRRLDAAACRPP